MRTVAPLLLAAALIVIALAAAPTAAAHATRIATDPAVDAVLDSGPSRVSATFNEKLQTTFVAMTVVGPDGNLWSSGQPRVEGAVVSVDVMPLGPVGTYTVDYRVTSADGHVVSGSMAVSSDDTGFGPPGPARGSTSVWCSTAGVAISRRCVRAHRRWRLVGAPPPNTPLTAGRRKSRHNILSAAMAWNSHLTFE